MTRQCARCDTKLYRDTVLYVATGGLRHGKPRRCNTARQRVCARSDMAGHSHDMARHRCDTAEDGATIRPSTHHDTALCSLPGRCAHAAWVQGVHPMHPKSLLGTLFMNTVHEHCS